MNAEETRIERGEARPGWLSRLFRRKGGRQAGRGGEPLQIHSDQIAAERYRTLGWMLVKLQKKQSLGVLTITSAVAGEGKSTVALNLASVLAERKDLRVLLIDCDLRRPRLYETLGGDPLGLREFLEGSCAFEVALHQAPAGFFYIPTIVPSEDALRLLSNDGRLEELVLQAREEFDLVILDAPPLLPVSDPLFLADASDSVLMVVRAGETSGRMVSRAISLLKREKVLGIVFNGIEQAGGYYYDLYYPAYGGRGRYGYRG